MDATPVAAGTAGAAQPGRALVGLPATELAARVRRGELTAVEVVRAHLAHIDAVEARIGAYRVVRHDAALAEAAEVDARPDRARLPLAGVPVAVKDNVAVAGEVDDRRHRRSHPRWSPRPTTRWSPGCGRPVPSWSASPGSPSCASSPPPTAPAPSPATRGTPRCPRPARRGAAPPPWPPAGCRWRTATTAWARSGCPPPPAVWSRSSPGTGVVPAGLGADSWSGMAVNGALATTVADLAVAHAVLADGAVAEPVDDDGAALVVAVSTRSPVPGARVDAEGRAAVEAVAERLRALGHTVVRRDPPVPHVGRGRRARPLAGRCRRRRGRTWARTGRPCSRGPARTPGSGGRCAGWGWSAR